MRAEMTQGRGADRYIVRELTGWHITPPVCVTWSKTPPHTDVYVMDRLYGFEVCASYPATKHTGDNDLRERQLSAQSQANRWNEEHRAWLHAGRWADGRVS